MHQPSLKMMDTGVSMLVPAPYDFSWTRLGDGTFNAYPPQGSSSTDARPHPDFDAVFAQVIPVPFNATVAQTALVPANARRAYLLIQNNSASGAGGDVIPNLYVTFDGPVTTPLQQNLVLTPGTGIVFDRRPPLNAIYIRWGTFTNTSGLSVAGGIIHQGLVPVR